MPMINLTREAGIKIGPVLLETLVKHYFERILRDDSQLKDLPQLRQDELLYDEAFNIVKAFLEASTKHTVEELQWFSNVRTPSPPWVHVVKTCVPISCCDEAATHLIKALGGEEVTKRIVGGTKWWQVRGVNGVDAEWIAAKKDWQEAKRRYKNQQKGRPSTSDGGHPKSRPSTSDPSSSSPNGGVRQDASENYQPEMDEMRCILYAHGGGYYFGSVDQERYSIQRHARKINGRVFAINYRLAPQYPFPCAIQDLLAAYLFLIDPPEGSSHRKVNPAHIVVAGDSAGGGLCIALLQVIRDAGLPMPAGGVLISPWCDLTHSFPSIQTNTATDVMPPYGLSLYKPSTLWPPPPEEITIEVQKSVKAKVQQAFHLRSLHFSRSHIGRSPSASPVDSKHPHASIPPTPATAKSTTTLVVGMMKTEEHFVGASSPGLPRGEDHTIVLPATDGEAPLELHLGSTASLPRPPPLPSSNPQSPSLPGSATASGSGSGAPTNHFPWTQTVSCITSEGKLLTIEDQIQLYAPNRLLGHPLICPVASYLGGLPPLLVIASEKEVLRDEIIYFAHKAADPAKYPVSEQAKEMYPNLKGIEERGLPPTKVHLQVYDDTAHVLPVLFSFTTPAKYCYRAMATFIKHVTGLPLPSSSPPHILTSSNPGGTMPFVDSPSNLSDNSNPMDKPVISRARSDPALTTAMREVITVTDAGGNQNEVEDTSTESSGSIFTRIPSKVPSQEQQDKEKYDKDSVRKRGNRYLKSDGGSSTFSDRISLRRAISATATRVNEMLHPRTSRSAFLTPPVMHRSHSDSRLERGDVGVEVRSGEASSTAVASNSVGNGVAGGHGISATSASASANGNGNAEGRTSSDWIVDLKRKVTLKGKERERNHSDSLDVAGPRFRGKEDGGKKGSDVRRAGEASVYANGLDTMIRERVSTQGVIRPLEHESSLPAFALPHDLVGVISEAAIRRYSEGKCKFDKKFKKTVKNIEKDRKRNFELAKKDVEKSMSRFKTFMERHHEGASRGRETEKKDVKDGETVLSAIPSRKSKSLTRHRSTSRSALKSKSRTRSQSRPRTPSLPRGGGIPTSTSGSWSWAWALDSDERPPPSSIVSRRDTDEAVRLARIADQCVLMEENVISGNNLWSMIVNFLTVTPDKQPHSGTHQHHHTHYHHHRRSNEHEKPQSSAPKPVDPSNGSSVAPLVSEKKSDKDAVDGGLDGGKSKESVSKMEKFRSRFAQFVAEQRKFHFFGSNDEDNTTQQSVQAS